jgi:hypothetical protein
MLSRRLRLKLWEKIAQTPPPSNLPTTQVAQTTTVSGSPPTFLATDWYPGIIVGFQAKNTPIINGLANLLNTAIFYTSNGQFSFPWMRQQNFVFGTDQFPSVDLRNLMNFSKLLYQQIFTNLGAPYQQPLTPQQIAKKIALLRSSQFLGNLSSTSPTSQLAGKIRGNVRELIANFLLRIK